MSCELAANAIILLGFAAGLVLSSRAKARSRLDRIALLLIPPALAAFGERALVRIIAEPWLGFQAMRLVPSFALVNGYALYPGPEQGPILDFIYGPVSALAYVPVTAAWSPNAVLVSGAVLTVVLVFAPMAWLHLRSGGGSAAYALLGLLGFCFLAAWDAGLRLSGFHVHPDAPALGLGACACACATSSRGTPPARALLGASVLAWLSVLAKQPMAPLLAALPLFLLVHSGLRAAVRQLVWIAISGSLLLSSCVLWQGLDGMMLNMIAIPYGDTARTGAMVGKTAHSLARLLFEVRWPAAILVLVAFAEVRRASDVRELAREHPWTLLAGTALLMAPLAAAAASKLGGHHNSLSFASYFAIGAATLGLTDAAEHAGSATRSAARVVLVVIAVLGILDAMAGREQRGALRLAEGRIASWSESPVAQGYAFVKKHPGVVYLPYDPLPSLMAEGKLYHSAHGIGLRAGLRVTPDDDLYRAHIPAALRFVAIRDWFPEAPFSAPPQLRKRLRRIDRADMPGWKIYRFRQDAKSRGSRAARKSGRTADG